MNTRFKDKKKTEQKLPSIYNLHLNKLNYFESLQKSLPQQRKLLNTLSNKTFESEFCPEYIKNKDNITLTKQRIKDIVDKKEENYYWLYAYPIFVEYETDNNSTETCNGIIQMSSNTHKDSLVEDYLKAIGNHNLVHLIRKNHNKIPYICSCCNSNNLVEELSFIICMDCGIINGQEVDSASLSYKESQETEYISHYYYKRVNHFNECLAQLQAKENTTIPDIVYDKVKEEIIRKRVDLNNLTLKMVKSYLKKNNLSKYTENSHTILFKITGKHKITISPNLEETLKKMFNDIQGSFEKHKDKRKNFLNYNYCFYKFFELLGLPEYLEFFPLLKDRHKLFEHDVIWKKICEDMGWEFTACR